MSILRLTCSPQGTQSESYQLSQHIVQHLLGVTPEAELIELNTSALPHVDAEYAATLGAPADPDKQDSGSLALSASLMRSLVDASSVVIATPMHNYTVPSGLKAWIDHVVRVRHSFHATSEGKVGTLSDRPVYVAVSSGAMISGDRARQPDFLTPYLRTVFATIGIHDVHFFSVQGSAFGEQARALARQQATAEIAQHFANRC
ncbi:FMN-dependent NADH-azoreductase [Paenalcaligenes suwonensis]|uniref:FMN-dependent NADH-azoreductase n=1 Tax=Paenalcaligenes suwonensis TaxID=1202713 RepID=UPI00140C5F54|nr:NAD(P)H-dependent oxidoreductase [Paenalcaligenes suwonensis]NHC62848.1 flavodoxin family protein [Paenalcaligenes suwonensis]